MNRVGRDQGFCLWTRLPDIYCLTTVTLRFVQLSPDKFLTCADRRLNTRILEKENYDDRDWREKKQEKPFKMAKRGKSLRPYYEPDVKHQW